MEENDDKEKPSCDKCDYGYPFCAEIVERNNGAITSN